MMLRNAAIGQKGRMQNCLCVKLILQIIYDQDEIGEDDGDYLWGLELLVSHNALEQRDSCLILKPFKNLHIIVLFYIQ